MINSIRYSSLKTKGKDRDGKDVEIVIPANQTLNVRGPILNITITQPPAVAQKLIKEGKQPLAINVQGLIDTGAAGSVISPSVAHKLGLIQTGTRKVTSVQDEQDRPVYFAAYVFPWGAALQVSVAACPIKGVECLIGRDVLRFWHFTYNGRDGSITICD